MSRKRIWSKALLVACALLGLLLIVGGLVLAQGPASFDHRWHLLSGGGAPARSGSFVLHGSLSQLAIGDAENGSYKAQSGYWYGAPTDDAQSPIPVGGVSVAASKRALLASWIGVALLLVAGAAFLIRWRRALS